MTMSFYRRFGRLPSGLKLVNLLLGGWTGVVFAFLYLPIILLIIFSFNASPRSNEWTGFTFDWYKKMAANERLMQSALNSVIIAGVTTLISVVLGTLGAWLMYRYRYPLSRAVGTLIVVPMIIPEVIMGVSLLMFFAMTNGRLNDWLETSVFGLGFVTVTISHVTFCFPFVLIAVQARLAGLDPSLEEAAMDLGATPLKAFMLVMLPYLLPAIISGALMSFTLSMDELIVTFFVSDAGSRTLPLEVYGLARKGLDPSLNAISALFVTGTVLLVLASEWFRRRV